jgi:hypothetical protein
MRQRDLLKLFCDSVAMTVRGTRAALNAAPRQRVGSKVEYLLGRPALVFGRWNWKQEFWVDMQS